MIKAGFWRRLCALIIDLLLLVALGLLIVFNALRRLAGRLDAFWEIVGLVIIGVVLAGLYFVESYSTSGQTRGMKALGIRLITLDGTPLTWDKGLLRFMGFFTFVPLGALPVAIAILLGIPIGLSYLWTLWDRYGQTWHDKIAGTMVVTDEGQKASFMSPEDARRRQRRWLVGLSLPVLLLWCAGAFSFVEKSIDFANRINATRWVDRAASANDAVSIDMSVRDLQLAGVRNLRADGIPGQYSSGAVAEYTYQGRIVTWLAALKYKDQEGMRQDVGVGSLASPLKPFGMERLLLDKYCPARSCEWAFYYGSNSYVIAIAADNAPAISIDVLGLVRESPRRGVLRWVYRVFTKHPA